MEYVETMGQELQTLFERWRAFDQVACDAAGTPDYSPTAMQRQLSGLAALREQVRLDTHAWPLQDQVDYRIVHAEMCALDFHLRVLQPWARDPAFYRSLWTAQSDTPDHEGPTHQAMVELWAYQFPLAQQDQTRLAAELSTIAPLLRQARENLIGDARDLWLGGISTLRGQLADLDALARRVDGASAGLAQAVASAREATRDFIAWLQEQAPRKTGPSGVGKPHYNWYLRHVHLLPFSWDDEVALHRRELARAHASLRLEEHRNRHLPALAAPANALEYAHRADAGVTRYMQFLREHDILPMRDYLEPALRAQTGSFVPEETRHFFAIARHLEPMTLWTHWYHWFEVAQAQHEPHARPVRRAALHYNLFAYRSEGLATAMEEMMLHAGLYDHNPRAREIVWVMLAQRAARGLAALYAQANMVTMQEAQDFHVRHTPRGWMRADLPLVQFEQHLYLRQPGYGTSYVAGKAMVEQMLGEFAQQRGDTFRLSDFFAGINAIGIIPASLVRWELTGQDDGLFFSAPTQTHSGTP